MMGLEHVKLNQRRTKQREFEQEAIPQINLLYRYALRFSDDPSQAEDWVQDAFLRAYRGWGSYQPGTNIRAWLLTILRNTIVSHRRRSRRVESVDFNDAERYPQLEQFQDTDPENRFFAGLVSEQVLAAVSRLPEKMREVVVLSDVEGLSYAEIAEVLGLPIGTVKSRLFRGRRTLQAELYDYARHTYNLLRDSAASAN